MTRGKQKWLCLGIVVCFAFLGMSILFGMHTVTAKAESDGNLIFNLINNGSEYDVCIDDKSLTTVVVPNTYKGKPITKIANNGFASCANLKKVVIPHTVKYVGNNAFLNCKNLETVMIPRAIEIGDNAFAFCRKLNFVITESVEKIGAMAFRGFTNASTIYIAGNRKASWDEANAFSNCNAVILENELPEVEINYTPITINGVDGYSVAPEQVIENKYANVVLSSEKTPDGKPILQIDSFAFLCCQLNSLTIMESEYPINICSNAFVLSDIDIINICETATFYNENLHPSLSVFASSTLKYITLPKNMTALGDDMFSDCEQLLSISMKNERSNVLPYGIKEIGENAFKQCYSLKSIEISEDLDEFYDNACAEWNSNQKVIFNHMTIPNEWRGQCGEAEIITRGINVSFETYINETISPLLIDRFTKTFQFSIIDKAGYAFGGWYDSEGATGRQISDAQGNLVCSLEDYKDPTFYAKWNIATFTITYITNGGTLPDEYKMSFTIEDEFPLPIANKKGYIFEGWTLSNGSHDTIKNINKGEFVQDIVLYATFSKYCTVEFRGNGAITGWEDGIEIPFGVTKETILERQYIQLEDEIMKPGHTVMWSDGVKSYELGADYFVTDDVIFNAVFIELPLSETSGRIYTAGQLNQLRDEPNYGKDGWYLISADIIVDNWVPIARFEGYLVNEQYSITINSFSSFNGNTAFIAYNMGTLQSLKLNVNLSATSGINAAALVGENGVDGKIRECVINGSINSRAQHAGAICGQNEGFISQCKNYASITSEVGSLGGIVGTNRSNGELQYNYNYGKLYFSYSCENIGGVVGTNEGNTVFTYNYAMITFVGSASSQSYGPSVGGAIGLDASGRSTNFYYAKNCINTGTLTGQQLRNVDNTSDGTLTLI